MLSNDKYISSYAESVRLTDNEERQYGDIILGISPDSEVYHEDASSIIQCSSPSNNFKLVLLKHIGNILMPKYSSIEIDSDRRIKGTLSSPAVILGNGDVELTIPEESNLELCVEMNAGSFMFNGVNIPIPQKGWTYGSYIREWASEYNIYRQRIAGNISSIKNIFLKKELEDEMKHEVKKISYANICRFYNLVYIDKPVGDVKISYEGYKNDGTENYEMGTLRNSINYLHRALQKAISAERFEDASEIQKDIRDNEKFISEYYKVVESYKVLNK